MVTEHRKLDCQFGPHYYREKSKNSLQVHLQGSRKVGCSAHISIKHITLFPEYSIPPHVTCSNMVSKKQLRMEREKNDTIKTRSSRNEAS